MALCVVAVVSLATSAGAWPFADSVIEYKPGAGWYVSNPEFNDPNRALGRPYGDTVYNPDLTSLVTLGDRSATGDRGYIVLGFDRPVWDDPRNPHGLDFIVFGNSVWSGGVPSRRWQEPAFVEISMDANDNGIADDEWYLLLPNKLPSQLVGSPATNCDTGTSTTILRNYAEYTPTLALPEGKLPEEFYTVPDRQSMEGDPDSLLIDEGSGGGDAFDIATAVKQVSPGVPVQPLVYAHLPYFNFIRITDALSGDWAPGLGEISAEIDAVADVAPLPGGESIGEAKRRSDKAVVSLSNKVVSAVFEHELYVQEEDRSSGIRVRTSDLVSVGDRVDVTGILSTSGSERFLDKASVYLKSHGSRPRPLGMPARNIGGVGLDNSGLLVKVFGRAGLGGTGWFYVNDGSVQSPGLRVRCDGIAPPAPGTVVRVTGISTFDGTPQLRVMSGGDISIDE